MNEMFLAQQGKPVMMFPIRETAYDTAKYGKLDLNRKMAEEMIANFKANALGTKPFIDKEHAEGEAAGWVEDLYLAAPTADVAAKTGATEALYAKVEWNGLGQKLLADKSYQYISPWWGDFKDPADGKVHHNVFMGAALCNNPVLRMMPAIELSERGFQLTQTRTEDGKSLKVGDKIIVSKPFPNSDESKGETGTVTELEGANVYWKSDKDGKEKNSWSGGMKVHPDSGGSGGPDEYNRDDNGRFASKLSDLLRGATPIREIKLADLAPAPADPIDELLADIDDVSGKVNDQIYGKRGAPQLRAFLKEVKAKLKTFKASDKGAVMPADQKTPAGDPQKPGDAVLGAYDPKTCVIDMMKKYGDMTQATKVCAALKAKAEAQPTAKLSDVLPEVEREISDALKQEKPESGGDTKMADENTFKLEDDPQYKAMQTKLSDQQEQITKMQREDLQRQASEIVDKEILGGFKLSAPSQQIITEILLSESPTEIKLSEGEGDKATTKTVSLADAMERLVDNLALVKMGETTKQKHDKGGSEDPEKKLSDLIAEKRKDDKDLTYRQASEQVQKENPDLAVALAG